MAAPVPRPASAVPNVRLCHGNLTHVRWVELLRIAVRFWGKWVSLSDDGIAAELVRRGVFSRDWAMEWFVDGWHSTAVARQKFRVMSEELASLGLCKSVRHGGVTLIKATEDGAHTVSDWDDPSRDSAPFDG